MRWVVAHPGPEWSVADVCTGWVEALRGLGEDVHLFNLGDRLAFYDNAYLRVDDIPPDAAPGAGGAVFRKALPAEQAVDLAVNGLPGMLWKVRPDVLLVICGFLIPGEVLDHARRHGARVIVVHTEEPYEVERELALAAHADLNLINDPTHAERFAAVAPTVYVPHAWRPGFHEPGPPDPALACDLAFIGTGFGSRRWFFEDLAASGALDGLDVLLGGNWQGLAPDSPLRAYIGADDPGHCIDNDQTARTYRSARSGINLYRREAENGAVVAGWAVGPREVEMAACGLFFLRDPRPEGDRLFHMLPTFESPDEAGEQLAWWLAHDAAREKAAHLAREAVADRTFTEHATALVRLLTAKE